MLRRVLVITALTLPAGVAEAQAATVYEYCNYYCNPVFVASNGEVNSLTTTATPRGWALFADSGAIVILPVNGDWVSPAPSGVRSPDQEYTLKNCSYTVTAAECRTDQFPVLLLGDRNDSVAIDNSAYVHCGPGFDTVSTNAPWNVADDCERVFTR